MYFQIEEVILWPRKVEQGPRRVPFQQGKVNIISGASRTGKSAVIPIIDYCLGSGTCRIPVNTIRDATSWFGVLIRTAEGTKLFARREPGSQRSTGDMFVIEGPDVEVPQSISVRNTTVDAVKRTLDELAGLTLLDFDALAESRGFASRPSFRDLNAFIFQPQNLVANPDVLFYKADTHEHREKLRTVFPFVLGAVDASTLAAQNEASSLSRELRRKEAELSNLRQVSARWVAQIRSQLSEAREIGLTEAVPEEGTPAEELIGFLERAISNPTSDAHVTEVTLTDAIEELMQLREEEGSEGSSLLGLRRRFAQMSELRESSTRYEEALRVQRDRLRVAEWLKEVYSPEHECPICGSNFENSEKVLEHWVSTYHEVQGVSASVSTVPAAFDREFERVRNQIRVSLEKLQGLRSRIKSLEATSVEVQSRQYSLSNQSRFVGRVEAALESYRTLGQDSELAREVVGMRERLQELQTVLSRSRIEDRILRARRQVEANALRLLPTLDAENPNLPITLSLSDLTVKVSGVNREDYLWELGSGSNWLSYHVAISLALQQYFLRMTHSPVPSFLVFDQPSQVYFPRKLATRDEEEEQGSETTLTDEDVIAVRNIFSTMDQVVQTSNGQLQIIVLDHAGQEVWGDLANVNVVEIWRDGLKLVPHEWL